MKKVLLSATALVVLLSACGQKGPLYLPDAEGTVVTRPTQTAAPQPTSPAPAQSPNQSASPVDTEKNRKSPQN
jgi:predicted small lipoprotein YifL